MAAKKLSHQTRLHPSQSEQIAKVGIFREEASDLRSRVATGSYDIQEAMQFWNMASRAGPLLHIANSELAERAGLGLNFFTTVVRDRRRPKISNFLRALTTIIEIADERLFDIDHQSKTPGNVGSRESIISSRLSEDHDGLLAIALSLNQMAKDEIAKLDAERPNDIEAIERNEKQRELLQIFADGFERIAQALSDLTDNPNEPILLGRAGEVVASVSNEIASWWKKNGSEAVDWAFRLPVLVGGVAALGWAGANIVVGTTVVAALVGGDKVISAIKNRRSKLSK